MLDSRNYVRNEAGSEGVEQVRGIEAQSNINSSQLLNEGHSLNIFQPKRDSALPSGMSSANDLLGTGFDSTLVAQGRPAGTQPVQGLENDKRIYTVGGQRGTMESGTFKPLDPKQ